jgi:hypothetical protein
MKRTITVFLKEATLTSLPKKNAWPSLKKEVRLNVPKAQRRSDNRKL